MCLAGMVAAIRITSLLEMAMLRNAFVTSVCRLTLLHAPAQMQVKNAKAFRALLVVADENGDHLHVGPPSRLPSFSLAAFPGFAAFSTCLAAVMDLLLHQHTSARILALC